MSEEANIYLLGHDHQSWTRCAKASTRESFERVALVWSGRPARTSGRLIGLGSAQLIAGSYPSCGCLIAFARASAYANK